MISYEIYKLVHLVAILTLFVVAGGAVVHAANRGAKQENALRRAMAILHGVALFFILLGGFGMLARLKIQHAWIFPLWLWCKLGIWLLLAFALMIPYRRPQLARVLLFLTPLVGGIAAFLAIFKPF